MKIEDFIIQNIHVDEVQGKKVALIYVNFKGTRIPFVGLLSEISSMHICYHSKRPKEMKGGTGCIKCYLNINDFFRDLTAIAYFLNSEVLLDDNAIFKAVDYVCGEHIKRTGRLMDSDLFSYIDLSIIAKNTIWMKLNNYSIQQAEATALWTDLYNHASKIYENYIYTTIYDVSDAKEPIPYLVKIK
jgi:hypothetical protein